MLSSHSVRRLHPPAIPVGESLRSFSVFVDVSESSTRSNRGKPPGRRERDRPLRPRSTAPSLSVRSSLPSRSVLMQAPVLPTGSMRTRDEVPNRALETEDESDYTDESDVAEERRPIKDPVDEGDRTLGTSSGKFVVHTVPRNVVDAYMTTGVVPDDLPGSERTSESTATAPEPTDPRFDSRDEEAEAASISVSSTFRRKHLQGSMYKARKSSEEHETTTRKRGQYKILSLAEEREKLRREESEGAAGGLA